MGFRFRKSINLGKSFRINISKSGIGYSFGTKGARITKTAKGTRRTTLSIPGTGISYVKETRNRKRQKISGGCKMKNTNNSNDRPYNKPTPWLDLIICYFFGLFGVHKFRERKIGIGILYVFTLGLFGIGWIVDCIKYLIIAIKSVFNNDATTINTSSTLADPCKTSDNVEHDNINSICEINQTSDTTYNSTPINHAKNPLKNTILWILTVFVALIAMGTIPSFSSIFALLIVLAIIPIAKWQDLLNKSIKKKVKNIISIVLAILVLATFSANTAPEPNDSNDIVINTNDTDFETNDNITEAETHADKTEKDTFSETTKKTEATEIPETTKTPDTTKVPETTPPHEHLFTVATCTEAASCSCGETKGSPNGHSWKEATCTEPKTCTVCKATEGIAIGHAWENPTCFVPKTCIICKATEGYATGHNYSNGKCTNCGGNDPNYVQEKMVWIPTNGGTKYHSKSTCSGMDDPLYVTISEAERQGFTPCGKCYR